MKIDDILKYFNGNITEFREWLAKQDATKQAELRQGIVYIHPGYDKDEPEGESGWLYVRGAYFTASATGTSLSADERYLTIKNNVISIKAEMILNATDIASDNDDALVTLGFLKEFKRFDDLN